VVPEGCLVLREDQKTVFVVADDNKVVQQRVLKLGDAAGGWVQILGGLKEGERIVVAGQHKLKDGATIRIGSPGEATK
jgi:multidrug efflux pump subunit AcrA (membrane-fusion protein)